MRKPVHVETGIWQTDSGEIANALYSFCDDGTMWELREDVWRRLPDIPQDEPGQPVTSTDVVAALRELTNAVEEYIQWHDICGDNHGDTFQASKRMRFNKDAARAVLKRIDEQEEPR